MAYLDNYEEALESVEDVRRSLLIALIDRKITKYFSNFDGLVKKLEKDKITATHFMASIIFAYVTGDILVASRPVNMKNGRLFYYRQGEEPSDVLGIKFQTNRDNRLINPTRFDFPSPKFEEHAFEVNQLKPYQFKKKQDK